MSGRITRAQEVKQLEADSLLLRQKMAIERNASRRPKIVGNLIPWEQYRR